MPLDKGLTCLERKCFYTEMAYSLREKRLFLYYVLYLLLDKVILETSGLPILRVYFINRMCLFTFLKMKMLLTK